MGCQVQSVPLGEYRQWGSEDLFQGTQNQEDDRGFIQDNRPVIWAHWMEHNFLFNLAKAYSSLEDLAARQEKSVEELLLNGSGAQFKRGHWQRLCAIAVRSTECEQLQRHLRRKLDRWSLATLSGHRVHKAISVSTRLGSLVRPCVLSAVLKALLGGWTTHSRSPCLFKCEWGRIVLRTTPPAQLSRSLPALSCT